MLPFHTIGELAAQHLTGRTQGRVGWFGRVILQVEVKSPMPRYPAAPQPPWEQYDPWALGSYKFWRDATSDDLVKLAWRRSPPEPSEADVICGLLNEAAVR